VEASPRTVAQVVAEDTVEASPRTVAQVAAGLPLAEQALAEQPLERPERLPPSPFDQLRIARRSAHHLPTEHHNCRRMPYLSPLLKQNSFQRRTGSACRRCGTEATAYSVGHVDPSECVCWTALIAYGASICCSQRINAGRNALTDLRKLVSKVANSAPPGPASSLVLRLDCRDAAIDLGHAPYLGSYRESWESDDLSRLRRPGQNSLELRKGLAGG